MKSAHQQLLDLIPNPKAVGARATFRLARPIFTTHGLLDNLGITDPTKIDACAYGTGILRVTNFNNTLYTQYVSDVGNPWPNWTNTGVALLANTKPAVDDGYVWYTANVDWKVHWRDYRNWAVDNIASAAFGSTPYGLAPIGNQRCYRLYYSTAYYRIGLVTTMAAGTEWQGGRTDATSLLIDAVTLTDANGLTTDYLYYMDRDAGRIVELRRHISNGQGWGAPHPIIPIDAIDNNYGLKMYGASVINGKVYVTGRLTRTSDGPTVSMDVYLIGPEDFQFGRDMFISSLVCGSPLLLVGSKLMEAGPACYADATAPYSFGVDNIGLKVTTSDIEGLRLTESENRSSFLDLSLNPTLSHASISRGAEVQVEVAYNNNWMTVFTGEVDQIHRENMDGNTTLSVHLVSKTPKRINQWEPDQGIYVPSQAYTTVPLAYDLSQIIRVTPDWKEVGGCLTPTKYNQWGVLMAAGRASRGGVMRAQFRNEETVDSIAVPRFGVGLNYYHESKGEAALRLGIPADQVTDEMCGHNGIVAVYERKLYANPTIVVYKVQNSVWTSFTSATVTLPTGWVWLELNLQEGFLQVRYHADANPAAASSNGTWTAVLSEMVASTAWWFSGHEGQGCVVLQKQLLISTPCYALGEEDTMLGVGAFTSFPASGTVLVDDEMMLYDKSTSALPSGAGSNYYIVFNSAQLDNDPGFSGHCMMVWAEARRSDNVVVASTLTGVDHSYQGLAAVLPYDGRTFRITDWDLNGVRTWNETDGDYSTGWAWKKVTRLMVPGAPIHRSSCSLTRTCQQCCQRAHRMAFGIAM
jgi:hypothetical protein